MALEEVMKIEVETLVRGKVYCTDCYPNNLGNP